MRVRVPFPWEGQPDPLDGVRAQHPAAAVALPEVRDVPPARVTAVTYSKGEVRRGMDGLQRRLREHGASSEYAREQALKVAPILERNGGRA